ncbi:hypothetical protein [Paenibacillus sp. 1P03SA]|uniref:hypothetical protein n=1 Tax=Paenibacillus sp. 1P03SA TaxID=3132294 RepID=UPI00399F4CAA
MKVQVYAAADENDWQWHISLAMAVDFTYWFERLGRSVRIVLLEPPVSIGQALALIDLLSSPSCKKRLSSITLETHLSICSPHLLRQDSLLQENNTLPIHRSYSTGKRNSSQANSDCFTPSNAIYPNSSSPESLSDFLQASALNSSTVDLRHSPAPDSRNNTFSFLPEELARLSSPMPTEIIQSLLFRSIDYDSWFTCALSVFPDNLITYDRLIEALHGRSLLSEEVIRLLEASGMTELLENGVWKDYIQAAYLNGDITLTNGLQSKRTRKFPEFWRRQTDYSCKRCGSGKLHFTPCYHCGTDCPYCEECLTMGRVRSCTLLIEGTKGSGGDEGNAFGLPDVKAGPRGMTGHKKTTRASANVLDTEVYLTPWGLSPAQTAASKEALAFLSGTLPDSSTDSKEAAGGAGILQNAGCSGGRAGSGRAAPSFLIWAVTGAGKTEMIFPLLQYELAHGRKIAIATPRRDVVLETAAAPDARVRGPQHRDAVRRRQPNLGKR